MDYVPIKLTTKDAATAIGEAASRLASEVEFAGEDPSVIDYNQAWIDAQMLTDSFQALAEVLGQSAD